METQNTVGALLLVAGSILLAWTFGCSAPESEGLSAPGCELTVRFVDDAKQAGARALDRINAATGCQVREEENGVPVLTMPVASSDKGESCGLTYISKYEDGTLAYIRKIEISTAVAGCADLETTIIHEVFHAMIAEPDVHADHGVFHAVAGNGPLVDDATLSTVCSHMVCPAFNPE